MNNLYNRIYEAVDNGIQKGLFISNTQDNDTSVSWHEKNMSTESDIIIQDTYEKYVQDLYYNLIYDEYSEYDEIINYYNITRNKYKIKDILKLNRWINKLKGIENFRLDWTDINKYISIILDNGLEIPFYNFNSDAMNPLFLKVSNDDLRSSNNDILIYIPENHLIKNNIMWQYYDKARKTSQVQPDEYIIKKADIANIDYSGYETCCRIIKCCNDYNEKQTKSWKLMREVEAVKYCMKIDEIPGYTGYLPSMGQLRILSDYANIIDYVLAQIGAKQLNINYKSLWSSTEFSYDSAWQLSNGKSTFTLTKDTIYTSVLPTFIKK